jgi:hypothetical protein
VNKPILLVAMLAMVLLAAAPALTQTAPTDIEASPEQATDAVQTAEDAAVDPAAPAAPAAEPAPVPASQPTPAPADITVGCELLYSPPGDQCVVDANGEITLPDGTTAPVLVSPAGDVFVQDTNGALTLVGTGASFITTEDSAAGEVQPAAEPAAEPAAQPAA